MKLWRQPAKFMTSEIKPITTTGALRLTTARTSLRIAHFLFVITSLFFAGCVSVDFKPAPSQKSESVQFSEPSKTFEEVPSAQVDRSWRNVKNGATISFLSECNSPTDPTLEHIFTGITSELDEVEVIDSQHVDYNSRDALHSQVEGKIDGVKTRFELMIFKKNHCTYVLTYASAAEAFASGQKEFRKFVTGFTVP